MILEEMAFSDNVSMVSSELDMLTVSSYLDALIVSSYRDVSTYTDDHGSSNWLPI